MSGSVLVGWLRLAAVPGPSLRKPYLVISLTGFSSASVPTATVWRENPGAITVGCVPERGLAFGTPEPICASAPAVAIDPATTVEARTMGRRRKGALLRG